MSVQISRFGLNLENFGQNLTNFGPNLEDFGSLLKDRKFCMLKIGGGGVKKLAIGGG